MSYVLPYQQLFETCPIPYLILQADVDFTVVAMNNKYLEIMNIQREAIIGCCVFDISLDHSADFLSVSDLRISLNHVLNEKRPDVICLQKPTTSPSYDDSEKSGWNLINTPVFDAKGRMTHIVQHLEVVASLTGHSKCVDQDEEIQLAAMRKVSNREEDIKVNKPSYIAAVNQKLLGMRERSQGTEAHFQTFFDLSAIGLAIVLPVGNFLRVNHRMCEITGYSHDEMLRLVFQDITYPDDLDKDLDYVQQLVDGKITTYTMEKRYIRKDRSIIWVNITVSLVRKPNGEPDYLNSAIEDIQARKEIEATLGEVERLASLGHWSWNVITDEVIWSEELCRIIGYDTKSSPVEYLNHAAFYTEESWADNDRVVKQCLKDGCAYEIDAEAIRPDGNHRWVIIRGEGIRDANGRVIKLQGLVQDITERKLTEMALRESKEQFKLFIDYAPAALAMLDLELRYLALSRRWSEEFFDSDQDLLGVRHFDAFPELEDELKNVFCRCLAGEVIQNDNYRLKRADGKVQWLRWEIRPWYLGDGAIGGVVIFTEDITHKKQAEETRLLNIDLEKRIAKRNMELQGLNESLEDFVYSVSHDLKAPLRGVEGYSRLLEEDYADGLNDEARLFIKNIRAGIARMNQLINDLLEYSRMERRKLEFRVLDLTAIVRQVFTECNEEITSNRVEVMVTLSPLMVYGDSAGLVLVLHNLLSNAIKFSKHSPHPRIELGASQNESHVMLWIRDNGIGFDMQYSKSIFEIFERLHRQEDYPGTGIGLALVKKAMQRMGGRVWAQSVEGKEATFYLELPVA